MPTSTVSEGRWFSQTGQLPGPLVPIMDKYNADIAYTCDVHGMSGINRSVNSSE